MSTTTAGGRVCIPTPVAEELGQPPPLFIKWDDADTCLAGRYPTVTPLVRRSTGSSDKDDAIDRQAYFHLRKSGLVAAMHWDGPKASHLA